MRSPLPIEASIIMSTDIKTQKKEIIAREIDRLKKNNRNIKQMIPFAIIFTLVTSFVRPFFADNDFFFVPEGTEYIEESLLIFLFFMFIGAINFFITILRNNKRIERFKDKARCL